MDIYWSKIARYNDPSLRDVHIQHSRAQTHQHQAPPVNLRPHRHPARQPCKIHLRHPNDPNIHRLLSNKLPPQHVSPKKSKKNRKIKFFRRCLIAYIGYSREEIDSPGSTSTFKIGLYIFIAVSLFSIRPIFRFLSTIKSFNSFFVTSLIYAYLIATSTLQSFENLQSVSYFHGKLNFHQRDNRGVYKNCRVNILNRKFKLGMLMKDLCFSFGFWLSVNCVPAVMKVYPIKRMSKFMIYTVNGMTFFITITEFFMLLPSVGCIWSNGGASRDPFDWNKIVSFERFCGFWDVIWS